MKTVSSSCLLAALGVLSFAAGNAMAAVDTSEWKCETCPFEKAGVSGALDVGVGHVSDDSARFGDYTGLDKKGAYAVIGGTARYRNDAGLFGSFTATDLGLDSRSLTGELSQEGRFRVRLGYAEIPHRLSDTSMTPFLGVGGAVLTLPAGFPAVDTATMPLATTLRPVDLGFKRKRFDASATWFAGPQWSVGFSLRRDVRDGTQRLAGSFFSTAAQLVAPVDQTTDQLEVSTAYHSSQLQASLAYQFSTFRNGPEALTWTNPFPAVVPGSTVGQMALAPDNQFHQIVGSVGYQISPTIRASGDVAYGRMTQDSAYLASTLNAGLAVPTLPAASLQGRVDTFNGSVRLTASPIEALRLTASYARDLRDNRTPSLAYPALATDMFLGTGSRLSQPYSLTQDRLKLSADYRASSKLRASVGLDQDNRARTYQEVVTTRETTAWGRVNAQALPNLALSLKLAHAQRDGSTYGIATFVLPAENPLLRKYYLADRRRDSAGVRAELTVGENLSMGLSADVANDDYNHSIIGLTDGRSASLGADVAYAFSEQTQLHAYAQGDQMRSRQAGSQVYAKPDWWARNKDRTEVVGIGVKHVAMKGQLELAADLTASRTHSDVFVDAIVDSPPFPTASTSLDSVKLRATYKFSEKMSLTGSWWYERYDTQDWRLDGVLPATLPNLLGLGEQPARYRVNAVAVTLRYRF